MKKILLYLISCVVALSLQADVKALGGSWQMVGAGADFNLSEDSSLTNDDFSIIWYWDNGAWKAYSKDSNTANRIKNISGLWGDFVKKDSAFWIKAKRDIDFIPYQPNTRSLPHTKGWHMVSSIGGLPQILSGNPSIKSFFAYRNGAWSYAYRKNDGNITGNLKNFGTGEGGWEYLENNISKNSMNSFEFPSYEENFANFANKKLTFSNGLELTLDQNGTVLSNDMNYSDMNWSVLYSVPADDLNVYFAGIEVGNNKHSDFFDFYKDWESGNEMIGSIVHIDKEILPNGVNVEKNIYNDTNSDITLSISNYAKEKPIANDIQDIMDQLNALLTNGNVDAQGVIDGAKAVCLAYPNNNDAKVTLAIVNLIEVLNEPIAQSFVIDGNPLNLNSYFAKLTPDSEPSDLIEVSKSIASYSSGATTLLNTLCANLESSADILADVSQDKNYVFAYKGLNGKKLNYVDITILRSAMYLLAYKLEYLDSFQLGTDEWLKPIMDENIEYSKASIDPAGFLNSGTFFVNPNQTKLSKAKSLLIKSLKLYYGILESKSYDKGLLVKADDISRRNMRRKVHEVLQNLTGKSQYAVLMDESFDWIWDEQTQQYTSKDLFEKGIINLNALFDASSTITIKDLPTFKYDGVYNEFESKLSDGPRNDVRKELNLVYDQKPTAPNNINKIIYKVVTKDGTTLKGTNLLNELFKD